MPACRIVIAPPRVIPKFIALDSTATRSIGAVRGTLRYLSVQPGRRRHVADRQAFTPKLGSDDFSEIAEYSRLVLSRFRQKSAANRSIRVPTVGAARCSCDRPWIVAGSMASLVRQPLFWPAVRSTLEMTQWCKRRVGASIVHLQRDRTGSRDARRRTFHLGIVIQLFPFRAPAVFNKSVR